MHWFSHHKVLVVGVALVVGILLPLLAACGVSQQDFEAAKQQLAAKEQEIASIKQQIDSVKAAASQQATAKDSEIASLKQQADSAKATASQQVDSAKATAGQQVSTLQQQLAAKEKEAADLQKKVSDAALKTTLIYAQKAPIPTPPPPPAPLPPGVTPAPPSRPDAALLNEVVPFAFYVETLATSSVSQYGFASYPACVPNSQFKRGVKIVWRFEVFDTSTGKRVTDQDKASVKVNLPHGEDITSRFSRRGGTGPWMWSAGWDIPPDYPLGAFDYTITVVATDGRKGVFKMPSLVNKDRGIDSRLSIVD